MTALIDLFIILTMKKLKTVNVNPLYLIIPEFYGSIEEQKGYKYLVTEPPTDINNEVLTDYKKIWDEILENINKINNFMHLFKDYHKIKISSIKCEDEKHEINLPLNKLIKFNLVRISNRLIIEKDNELFLEAYLEECLLMMMMDGLKNKKYNW